MNKSPAVYGAFFVPVFVSSSDTLIRLCYIVLAKINILRKKSRRNMKSPPPCGDITPMEVVSNSRAEPQS